VALRGARQTQGVRLSNGRSSRGSFGRPLFATAEQGERAPLAPGKDAVQPNFVASRSRACYGPVPKASVGQGDVKEAPELGLLQDDGRAVGDRAVQQRIFVVSAEIRAEP
jgi:hypothetical protein